MPNKYFSCIFLCMSYESHYIFILCLSLHLIYPLFTLIPSQILIDEQILLLIKYTIKAILEDLELGD